VSLHRVSQWAVDVFYFVEMRCVRVSRVILDTVAMYQ